MSKLEAMAETLRAFLEVEFQAEQERLKKSDAFDDLWERARSFCSEETQQTVVYNPLFSEPDEHEQELLARIRRRPLFKGTLVEHAKFGVIGQFITGEHDPWSDEDGYTDRYTLGGDDEFKIISVETYCPDCAMTGLISDSKCIECGGFGWQPQYGKRAVGDGEVLEVQRYATPSSFSLRAHDL